MHRCGASILRAVTALPFLLISAYCYILMDIPKLLRLWQPSFDSNRIEWNGSAIPLLRSFYHIGPLDWYWRGLTVTFAPATLGIDPLGWWAGFQFLVQLMPLYAIWMLEARRALNQSTPQSFAILFMFLGQVFGTGCIVPIFYFIIFVFGFTPVQLEQLAHNREEIQCLLCFRSPPFFLPLILFLHLSSVVGAFFAPQPEMRHVCVWFWFLVPIWLGLGDELLTRLSSLGSNPTPNHAIVVAERHLGIIIGISVGIWIYMLESSPYSLTTIFVPNGLAHDDLVSHSRLVWQADFWCTFSSALLFLAYQCVGLYRAQLLQSSDWLLSAILPILVAVGGPGAAVAAGWLWKERVIRRIASSEGKVRT